MMKYSIVLLLMFLLAACNHVQQDQPTHESVRMAAQQYYTLLAKGDVDQFVNGILDADKQPEGYRSQLRDMIGQYIRQQESRGGIVRVVATADSLRDSTAYVFLDLHYGDSTVEQIGVNMVLRNQQWRMK